MCSTVYSVVLDPARNQACSGSMDGTVRVWNLQTGACQHTLNGHTSLVGLLGLSPSYLVSAAADSTLRIWDPDTGELQHTLAAHTGAITCFQHDEFKVLSGSDGTLKMWNIRDGTVVRDLLTGITGVWQVVFEGRWCVAASNRNDTTVLDVWDFGRDDDDDWVGEPPGWEYDEDATDDEDDDGVGRYEGANGLTVVDTDPEQAEIDAMDQDLMPSETESTIEVDDDIHLRSRRNDDLDAEPIMVQSDEEEGGVGASQWAPSARQPRTRATSASTRRVASNSTNQAGEGSSRPRPRINARRR